MKRHLRIAGLVAGVAIVAAACSGSAATNAPSTAPTTAPSDGASAAASGDAMAPLVGDLTIWHAYSSGAGTELDALNTVLAAVKAENPDLNVTTVEIPFADLFKKYETDAATGGGPDLFIAPNDSLGFEAREGVLADLDAALAGKLDGKTATAVAGSKVEGKLYMVPESLKAVALLYDSAKVATPPATTDDLLAGVKDGSIKAGFFGGKDGVYHNFGWWAAFGGALMDSSGKCVAEHDRRAGRVQVPRRAPDGRRASSTRATTTWPPRSRPVISTSSSTAPGPPAATRPPSPASRAPRCRPVRPVRPSRLPVSTAGTSTPPPRTSTSRRRSRFG